jgi:uncharacterized protein (TIGR02145 family)
MKAILKKIFLLIVGITSLAIRNQAQTVTDYDGNVYNTVTIGTQVWMKENLRVTHYRNGVPIPYIFKPSEWDTLTTGAYDEYLISPTFIANYGRLYNYFAVSDARIISPVGWHVPSDAEWTALSDYLINNGYAFMGIAEDIGKSLASTSEWTKSWDPGNIGNDQASNNSSGFTALPGGFRVMQNYPQYIHYSGFWWSSTDYNAESSWIRYLQANKSTLNRSYFNTKRDGYSIRCIKDSTAQQTNEIINQNEMRIYPNPASDRFFINCSERSGFKVSIYSSLGNCVYQRDLTSGTNEIDISDLGKGIYIIKLKGIDWLLYRKLIKE